MRSLLAFPLPLLLILLSIVTNVGSPIADQQESWLKARRFLRSASDPSSAVNSNNTINYDDLPEDKIKTDLDGATNETARLKREIENKRTALEAKVAENAGPKADFKAKKTSWESLNAIYEGLVEEKRKVDSVMKEFDTAEKNLNRTIKDLDAATKALETYQVELSEVTAKRDRVKDMPNRKPIAEREQGEATSNQTRLKGDEETKRGTKDTDEGAVNTLIGLIVDLNTKWKDNNCEQDPESTTCSPVASALESENGKLKTANETFIRTNAEWMEAKRKLDECDEKLKALTKEIDEINTAMKTNKTYKNAVNFAEAQLISKEDEEDPLKESEAKAKTEKDAAQKIYDDKKQAKDSAPPAPEGLDAAKGSASRARVELSMAEAVFTPLQTAEDKLRKELTDLEKSFKDEQEKVAALQSAYAKKTAVKPGKSSLTVALIGVFVALAIFAIIGIVLFKFVIWPKLKKKQEKKKAPSKDAAAVPSGGDVVVAAAALQPSNVVAAAAPTASSSQVQQTPESDEAAEQVAIDQSIEKIKNAPYLPADEIKPINVDSIQDEELKARIKAATTDPEVYLRTYAPSKLGLPKLIACIFGTNDKSGNIMRIVPECDKTLFCQDARKFKIIWTKTVNGQDAIFLVTTRNGNPKVLLYSAVDNIMLRFTETLRFTIERLRLNQAATRKSMTDWQFFYDELTYEYDRWEMEAHRRGIIREGAGGDGTDLNKPPRTGNRQLDRKIAIWYAIKRIVKQKANGDRPFLTLDGPELEALYKEEADDLATDRTQCLLWSDCEEASDNEDDSSRASAGSDDENDQQPKKRRGKKDEIDDLGPPPEHPGHMAVIDMDGTTRRLILLGNEKPPEFTRLTHESADKPRALVSLEDNMRSYRRIIGGYEADAKTGDVDAKCTLSTDFILSIVHQFYRIVREEPKLIERPHRETIAVGDIHGALDVMKKVLEVFGDLGTDLFMKRRYVFLGDFVDRGTRSIECGLLIMLLKIMYPDQVVVLRGNHESYLVNIHYGFLRECKTRLGEKEGAEVHYFFNLAFSHMPLAYLSGGILMMHGGIPVIEMTDLRKDINSIDKFLWDLGEKGLGMELAWDDPAYNLDGTMAGTRGTGSMFGMKFTLDFCKKFLLDLIVRAHQVAANGYEYFAGFMLATLFTCPSYDPDKSRNHGSILHITEDKVVRNIILSTEKYPFEAVMAHNRSNYSTAVKDGNRKKGQQVTAAPQAETSETFRS